MPYPFNRSTHLTYLHEHTYINISVPNNTSFLTAAAADFLVFDPSRVYDILGPRLILSLEFEFDAISHEASVFITAHHQLLVSRVTAEIEPILSIDLDHNPPRLSHEAFEPALFAPIDAQLYQNLIWYDTAGGISNNRSEYRPGIYIVDPRTWLWTTVRNNFGYHVNGYDHLLIDSADDV